MLTEEEISERNGYLIALVTELNLGFHVVDLPHRPKLLSSDYTKAMNFYVKNFNVFLKPTYETDEIYYTFKLKPLASMNLQDIKEKFLEWITLYQHKNIYTISLIDSNMFLVGFNHHNKILKKNPYPVFAKYDPITYYDLDRAEDVLKRFDTYNMKINA
jgi:hypothetical protein